MKDKVILVDCDGVLLDWVHPFKQWMNKLGYIFQEQYDYKYDMHIGYGLSKYDMKKLIRFFNESAQIRFLPPLRDAIHYVSKLHREHGYVFHCITSLSTDENTTILRTKNLQELFGKTVFEKIVYLDCGANKDDALEKYVNSGCIWVEDKVENAELGLKLGLDSILITHNHNNNHSPGIKRMFNWKEIYSYIAY